MSFSYWNFNIRVRISICPAINLILVTFVYVEPNVLALLPNELDWMGTADSENTNIDFGCIIWNCTYISDFNLKGLKVNFNSKFVQVTSRAKLASLFGTIFWAVEEACEKHETFFWSYSADGNRVRMAEISKTPSYSTGSATAGTSIFWSPTVKVTKVGSGYTLKILHLATSVSSIGETFPPRSLISRPSSFVSIASNMTVLAST